MVRTILFTLALAGAAGAAELPGPGDRVLPCRPTVACTAEISAPGQLEWEAGFQHKVGLGSRVESTPLLLKLSLTENFQLQLGTGGLTVVSGDAPASFFDASQVLGKLSFPLGEGRPTIGATAAVNLPTATLDRKRTDALFAVLVSQDVIGFHYDFNAGLNLLAVDAAAQVQGWAALSISHDLPLDLTGMIEGWHSTAAGALADRDGGFLFAAGWSPLPWVCFDVGGDVALFADGRRFSVFAGVTSAVADLWGGPARRLAAR
ncbi:MAG TPA: hypothetical protein VLW85_07450 [Myxococcales bacterium]|nr:hypothetical protein [Myxococcales bacterium]